ncbi:MAG TPA: phosphate signaling complex protein PhoU [Pirellulales bacterium]|jgi:phosphate transport system protein|nr:phosphate signaling complex protein PhoU [Pirellulales bacterium]
MSQHLSRQLAVLREKILHVGGCVEQAISRAVHALVERDARVAAEVVAADDVIDKLEVEVEEECLKTLALYQPVAADLRFVVSILKINNDLERMGDLAKNVAKRVLFLAECPPADITSNVRIMASKAQAMVKQSLDSLVEFDATMARRVREADDSVDALNKEIQAAIREHLKQSPEQVDCWLRWISVVKHIERMADMATHVAEDVIYMVEGDIVRHRTEE